MLGTKKSIDGAEVTLSGRRLMKNDPFQSVSELSPILFILQVFKHIPFPGKATYKIDIVEGHDFEVRTEVYPAPQKTVRSKDYRVGRKEEEQVGEL